MSARALKSAATRLVREHEQFAAKSTAPLSLTVSDRAWIGDLIETLILMLDQVEGDPDLEDGDLDRCTAADDGCGPRTDPRMDRLWRNAA